MATLDDLHDVLSEIRDELRTLNDNTGSSSVGSAGAAATGSTGSVAAASGNRPLGKPKQSKGQKLTRALGASAASGAAESFARSGGDLSASLGGAQRAVVGALSNVPVIGQTFQNAIDINGRATNSVASVVEQVARGGGRIDEAGVRAAFGRQREIESNVQRARETVAKISDQEFGETTSGEIANTIQPAVNAFVSEFEGITEAMRRLRIVWETNGRRGLG